MTNIGLGLTIFQNNGRCVELSKHNYLLWIYLGWLGFSLALEIFMYVATTMSALGSKGEGKQVRNLEAQIYMALIISQK